MLHRKTKNIPSIELLNRLGPSDRKRYFTSDSNERKAKFNINITNEEKEELQCRIFLSMPYDEKQQYCARPEQIDGPSLQSWEVINSHLGTNASSLLPN